MLLVILNCTALILVILDQAGETYSSLNFGCGVISTLVLVFTVNGLFSEDQ